MPFSFNTQLNLSFVCPCRNGLFDAVVSHDEPERLEPHDPRQTKAAIMSRFALTPHPTAPTTRHNIGSTMCRGNVFFCVECLSASASVCVDVSFSVSHHAFFPDACTHTGSVECLGSGNQLYIGRLILFFLLGDVDWKHDNLFSPQSFPFLVPVPFLSKHHRCELKSASCHMLK